MPMNTLELDTVSRGFIAAKKVLELKAELDALNVIYDSTGGVKESVNQADLDSVPSFSGLTETQLDDGMYALTNTLKTAIANSYTQLAHLAARAA